MGQKYLGNLLLESGCGMRVSGCGAYVVDNSGLGAMATDRSVLKLGLFGKRRARVRGMGEEI
jgi:hypothetical protein